MKNRERYEISHAPMLPSPTSELFPQIEHLHYTSWPDHNVPKYAHSVIAYVRKLQTLPVGHGPIIVHCSAGVGRTGTIILCDICSRQALAEGVSAPLLIPSRLLRQCRMILIFPSFLFRP